MPALRKPTRLAPIAALLLAGLPAPPLAAPVHAYATRHVVVVVIDGARWSEGLGAPGTPWHPRQATDLAPLGSLVETFLNDGATLTNPGHAAILTGTWQPISNDGTEPPHAPTAFEYYRAATGAPASQTWLIAEKTKLGAVAWSDAPGWGSALGAARDLGRSGDSANMAAAIARMVSDRPALLMVSLADVDQSGHANDWTGYLRNLQVADSLVHAMWLAIQADPELANTTTMLVTNDHGRHDDAHGGFVNHGDSCLGCRRIQLLALGPDFRAQHVSSVVYRQIDILPTVAELLGFPAPAAEGTVMLDLLAEPIVAVTPGGHRSLALSAPAPVPSSGPVRLTLHAAPGARVEVDVLDVHGRRVARLYHGHGADGPMTLVWDGRSTEGRRLPAGIYLVRARRGDARAVRRVVIAR